MIRNDHSADGVVFLQLHLGGDRNFSYVLGDRESGEGAIVDPGFEPERIAEITRQEKLVIKHILITHGHGDHMGGLARLVELSGASAHAGKQEHVPGTEPLYEGDHFKLGTRRVLSFFTPGHAPGHFCFLFEDRLMTGDLLFCGKVGGTGPFFSGSSSDAEWESLRRLMTLPGDTLVFPGHDYYGGQGQMPHSTMDHEREYNPFLLCNDFDAFCALKENWLAYKKEQGHPVNQDPSATQEIRKEFGTFSLSDARHLERSELSEPAWRWALMLVALCVAAACAHQLADTAAPASLWLVALLVGAAWICAVRFLLLDSRARIIWIVWLILSVVMLPSPGGVTAGVAMSVVFLVLRRYRPLRHLGSRRRAGLFLLGIIATAALWFGWDLGEPEAGSSASVRRLAIYALHSLRWFWGISLLKLVTGMRLHFLRLKPKLAASWFFIGGIPLFLLLVFCVIAIYGALGASRSTRASDILDDWVRSSLASGQIPDGQKGEWFVVQGDPGRRTHQGTLPGWWEAFESALAAPPAPVDSTRLAELQRRRSRPYIQFGEAEETGPVESWAPRDTTAYFHLGEQLWALRLQASGTENRSVRGIRIDPESLDRLSKLMRADVGILSNRNISVQDEGAAQRRALIEDSTYVDIRLEGRYQRGSTAADSSASFWARPLGFGGALLGTITLTPQGFYRDNAFMHLQVRLRDLNQEFLSGERNLNQVVLIALAFLAVMFLLLQIFALFFGFRITSGITSAVKLLHRGTRRLAKGDLDTRIIIPNEDEFGDLATSFNEMSLAVKRGREEAVARVRLERELQTAREIQERLLPHEVPPVPGFELSGTSIPSRQVGGDYYDFLLQDEGRCGVAVGDVSGKGMPAALLMANLQASLQGQVIHPSSVAEVVCRVNDLLVRSTDPHMFATFFYGVLDIRAGTFTSTNAGHNPPIVCHENGKVEMLGTGGLVLGMLPEQDYAQQEIQLRPGDVLVLYTDGITEAVGPRADGRPESDAEEEDEEPDDMFGDEALLEVVMASRQLTAAGIKEAILAAVARHTAGMPQSDDITLVVIKRRRQDASDEPELA